MLEQVDGLTQEIVELEQALVRIPSVNTGAMPTGNETEVAEFIRDWLGNEGISSEILARDPARGNIIAVYPGELPRTRLMLMSHTDVYRSKRLKSGSIVRLTPKFRAAASTGEALPTARRY